MTSTNRDAPLPTPTLSVASAAALLDVFEPGEGVKQIAAHIRQPSLEEVGQRSRALEVESVI